MKLITIIIAVLAPFVAFSSDTYVCTTEESTGFSYDRTTKIWSTTKFGPDKAFAIAKSSSDDYRWEVKVVGKDLPHMFCERDFTIAGLLYCIGHSSQELRFNNKSLRFLGSYSRGYWDENAMLGKSRHEGDDTPAIYIGTCGKL